MPFENLFQLRFVDGQQPFFVCGGGLLRGVVSLEDGLQLSLHSSPGRLRPGPCSPPLLASVRRSSSRTHSTARASFPATPPRSDLESQGRLSPSGLASSTAAAT